MSGGIVASVGPLNGDLLVNTARRPAGGETVTGSELVIGTGGKGANQAVAAARLGAEVVMLGAVGADAFGHDQRAALVAEGIDDSAVHELPDVATGTAIIIVDAEGENSIVISPAANGRVTAGMVDEHKPWFDGVAVLGMCLEIPVDAVLAGARNAHDAGATVVFNLSPYAEVPAELLALTDLLLVNQHELALLLDTPESGERPWADHARALADRGIRQAIVTLGAGGSVVLDSTGSGAGGEPVITPIAAVPVTPVDTTGCGDAYMGSILAALARGVELTEAAAVASRISAYAATKPGTQISYPTRPEAAELAWG